MRRNSYEKIKNRDRHKPFFLYGIKGVGKTYLCNTYINELNDAFIYFSPSSFMLNDKKFTECQETVDFLAEYYSISPEMLLASSIIFDDCEHYTDFSKKLFEYGLQNHTDWIFVSEYDFLGALLQKDEVESLELFPLQFDEYLSAFGYEWYAGALKEHLLARKKLPDILHNEIISDFDEYLFVGGMPQAVNDYLVMKSMMNTASIQRDARIMASAQYDTSENALRKNQILSVMDKMIKNKNQKFKFSEIREGASMKMFESALKELLMEKKVLIQREAGSERNFKLFYPEFSFLASNRTDGLSSQEYYLRAQNYILQTFLQKKINNCYWESGNRASLNFVIDFEGEKRPVNLSLSDENDLRSVASYKSREKKAKTLKIADTNFVEGEEILPIYTLFGL